MELPSRIKIQNFLMQTAKDFEGFLLVQYPSGVATIVDQKISPTTILCNETDSELLTDPKAGSKLKRYRASWIFLLYLHFDQEAYLDNFISFLSDNPLTMPPEVGIRTVNLALVRQETIHPVQQQGNQGTRLTLTFDATIGRN